MDFGKAVEYARLGVEALGLLVVLGGVFVRLTPTKEDDEFWVKLEASKLTGSIFKLIEKISKLKGSGK